MYFKMATSMCVVARNTLRTFLTFKPDKFNKNCILNGWTRTCSNRSATSEDAPVPSVYGDKDPAPLFFNERVQELLMRITGVEMEKVYRTTKMKISDPKYQFVTDDELNKLLEKAKMKARQKLQMPPVVKERVPIKEFLSYDPEIQGFENHTVLFTDITFGISDRNRIIVARDPDGTLRKASWEERERTNQIFFPHKGKDLPMPKLFLDEHLQNILNQQEYEFVLDKACIQFEPDDPTYIKVTKKVYDHIDKNGAYDVLKSTRHFGPMAFYFAFFKKLDNLLIHVIKNERLDDAVNLVQVYHHIHPTCKSANLDISPQEHIQFIRAYLDNESARGNNLELAIQTYEELQGQRLEYEKNVKVAHSPSE